MKEHPWWRAFLLDAFDDNHEIVKTFTTGGIQKVFSKICPREQEMILMRYQYNFTYDYIGKHFGVSKERIREIISRNRRSMRRPWNLELLTGNEAPMEGTPLAELGLSTMTFNALVRRNILTIEALKSYKMDDIYRFYHIGKVGVKEIIDKITEYDKAHNNEITEMREASKMTLRAVSKVIYNPGTASENRNIKVITMSANRLLWEGPAKELKTCPEIKKNWEVVEILVDRTTKVEANIPDYNRGKIIVVV